MSEICKQFSIRSEWDNESDEVNFEYKNYKCEIKRVAEFGILCGYIQIDLPQIISDILSVHGGVTYNQGGKIGFDCAHFGDLNLLHLLTKFEEFTYKNIEYVTKELRKLVDQIVENKSLIYEIINLENRKNAKLKQLEDNLENCR